ncbi:unnamed protein product, partial [Protopolystoma xenopodis]
MNRRAVEGLPELWRIVPVYMRRKVEFHGMSGFEGKCLVKRFEARFHQNTTRIPLNQPSIGFAERFMLTLFPRQSRSIPSSRAFQPSSLASAAHSNALLSSAFLSPGHILAGFHSTGCNKRGSNWAHCVDSDQVSTRASDNQSLVAKLDQPQSWPTVSGKLEALSTISCNERLQSQRCLTFRPEARSHNQHLLLNSLNALDLTTR